MSGCGFKPALFAVSCLLASFGSGAAQAGSAEALVAAHGAGASGAAERGAVVLAAHFRKTQSFYCYPKNYWWFYRPYTTASQGYARCMPYFHYLDEAYPAPRNLRRGEAIK